MPSIITSRTSKNENTPAAIDMDAAYCAFRNYIAVYDPENPKIALKIAHIVRVARKSRLLAERMNLPREDVVLAELIGLLHDIGRFEQIRQYNTFKDSDSVNHGLFGCQILFGANGMIRCFSPTNKYDDIIYTAIINHNRAFIHDAESMGERELLHAKMIRDTDKLDIFQVQLEEPNIALFEKEDISGDVLTPALYEDFCKEKLVDYALRSGSAPDSLVCTHGYVYDLNFDESCAMAVEDGYLAQMADISFDDEWTTEKMHEARDKSMAYCRKRATKCEPQNNDASSTSTTVDAGEVPNMPEGE